jgi:PhzF family phenazine biosynthesis protein
MQQIAAEKNLSESAFFVREENGVRLRWFAPTAEVDLCSHATLAAAHILFEYLCVFVIVSCQKSGLMKTRRPGRFNVP